MYERIINSRLNDKKFLESFGFKVFSQNDEDGIINEIFRRIGTTNKYFVEFGVSDGIESNSHLLLHEMWSGLWIEVNSDFIQKIHTKFKPVIETKRLKVINAFITKDNINDIIGKEITGEIDLLSIDIDGNDYYIWKAINVINPRVVIIEYNGKFPPYIEWIAKYSDQPIWNASDDHGASLKAYEILGNELGYQLVGTNYNGVNAFFVRKDLASDKFATPATAENFYNPLRPDIRFTSSHQSKYFLG